MSAIRRSVRIAMSWSHQWLGLILGLFFSVLAITGGIVTFRPQIASILSPPAPAGACVAAVDWTRAEQEIETFTHARINRIYTPTAPDTRFRFRMKTDRDAIYTHVIYDACSARILGTANLEWMDWVVDFHHNLRADHRGRLIAGWFGFALLASGVSGLLIWLLARPSMQRLFQVRTGRAMPRDLHSLGGVLGCALLLIASFTGLWLCFPRTMRAGLALVTDVPQTARPRAPKTANETSTAGLGAILSAAQRAIPDGTIREVRLPEGNGYVQVRMWRAGDFRSLGNNVVTVSRATAAVAATELYANQPGGSHFLQAMAGLHYGEWGGLAYRTAYGIAGLISALLLVTGVLTWWLPKRGTRRAERKSAPVPAAADAVSRVS